MQRKSYSQRLLLPSKKYLPYELILTDSEEIS